MQHKDLSEATDRELVDLANKGNISAFGCLYDRYIRQIYRYVYFRVANKNDAEDITEMTFLKTFELIKQDGSKIDNFKAWTYRTAHNLVIDHYRKQKNVIAIENVIHLHDSNEPPETAILNEEEVVILQQMVAKLEGMYQQVITYRFIAGLSYEETAQIMDIKTGNVRVIQFRALQKLRELLEKEEASL